MGKVEIPTEEEAEIKIRALCLKLMTFPEHFTLGELTRLQELMVAEGHMV